MPSKQHIVYYNTDVEERIAKRIQAKVNTMKKILKNKKNWSDLLDPHRPLKSGNIQKIPKSGHALNYGGPPKTKRSTKNDHKKDSLTIKQRRDLVKYLNQTAYAVYMWTDGGRWVRSSLIYFTEAEARLEYRRQAMANTLYTFVILSHKLSKI